MKPFIIHKYNLKSLDDCNKIKNLKYLPESINRNNYILLIDWSNIKNKKKWTNKNKLRNKFNKNFIKYLPLDLILNYETIMEKQIRLKYNDALEEIYKEEDKYFLNILKNNSGM